MARPWLTLVRVKGWLVSRLGIAIFPLALAVVFVMAVGFSALPHRDSDIASLSKVEPDESDPLVPEIPDLGPISVPGRVSLKTIVRNASDVALMIKDLRGDCACASVSPSSFQIDTGDSVELALELDYSDIEPHTGRGQTLLLRYSELLGKFQTVELLNLNG